MQVGKQFAHAKPWPSGECFEASFFFKAIADSIIAKMKEASKQTLASMLARNANILKNRKLHKVTCTLRRQQDLQNT